MIKSANVVPYGYAKTHGIVVTSVSDDAANVAVRAGAQPLALDQGALEVRRQHAHPITLAGVEHHGYESVWSAAAACSTSTWITIM